MKFSTIKRFYFPFSGPLVIMCYFFAWHHNLERVFGRFFETYIVFMAGTAVFLIGAISFVRPFLVQAFLSLVTPIAASFSGYVALSINFFIMNGNFVRGGIAEWLFASIITAYILAKLWWVSIGFLVISTVGHMLFSGNSIKKADKGRYQVKKISKKSSP